MKIKLLLASVLTLSLTAVAQSNSPQAVEPMEHTPTFRVTVVSRNVQAVNYKHRGGATKVDFAGTDSDAPGQRRGQSGEQERLHRNRSGSSATWKSPRRSATNI